MRPPSNRRERILLFGSWGTGKSRAWASIANWMRKNNSPGKVRVIDTDVAVEAIADGYPDFYNNVEVADAYLWPDYMTAAEKFRAVGTRDDWLVVDMIDKAWDAVQANFVERAFGKRIDEWFVEYRAEHERGGHPLAGEYGVNWLIINKMYNEFVQPLIRFPGHVLVCTPSDTVSQPDRKGEGGDDPEVLKVYGRFGVKPKGQKALGHQFHTVLWMIDSGSDWRITTIKDRERERLVNERLSDFALNYLVRVAKWQLGIGTGEDTGLSGEGRTV